MRIPRIQPVITDVMSHEFEIVDIMSHESKSDWATKLRSEILDYDSTMGALLRAIQNKFGMEGLISALYVYRTIESQLELDQLEEMFREDTV